MKPPVTVFSFSGSSPIPGDRLDAQFIDHAQSITSTQDAVDDIRRSDGALKNGIVTEVSLAPGLFGSITTTITAVINTYVTSAQSAASAAQSSAIASETSRNASAAAASAATIAAAEVSAASGSALSLAIAANNAAIAAASQIAADKTDANNSANHAAGDAAISEDWATVSIEWAEHMPDKLPPNILALTELTGDHWSSRWWANQAAQLVSSSADIYVKKSGSVMTGPLTLYNDPNGPLVAATKSYVDTHALGDAPNDGQQYVRKNALWSLLGGVGGVVPEAPIDGAIYGRRGIDATWVPVVGGDALAEAPAGGLSYARRGSDSTWQKALIQLLPATVVPAANGELVIEASSNGVLTFRFKGSDGTVRIFEMPMQDVTPPPSGVTKGALIAALLEDF